MKALIPWVKANFRNPDIRLLSALAIPTALVLCFGSLATEMREGETLPFDRAILLAFRNPANSADPIGPAWVETIFTDFTSLGSTTIFTIAAVLYLLLARKTRHALQVLVALGGGTLISTCLKQAFDRPRPDFVAHIVDVSTASFPSGHAMLSAVTYLTLGVLLARVETNARLRVFLLGLALFCTLGVGISRIYLGVHYPTDVLAGWMLGTGWAMLCWITSLWLERRGR
jgi:undecaprenyl-diphosphatase